MTSAEDREMEELAGVIENSLGDLCIRLGPNATTQAVRGEPIRLSGGEKWLIARVAARAALKHAQSPATDSESTAGDGAQTQQASQSSPDSTPAQAEESS